MAGGWPIKTVSLDNLDLDLENVRVPGGEADQTAVIRYLVEAEDVLDLTQDILRDGYIDIEPIVVVKEADRLVVLEGNRRTAALKCIADKTRAGKHETQVGRLLSRFASHDVPTRIRVMVAPSRDEALPLLARLHTGQPKKPWAREQQAVFYHSQLVGKTTVDDLKARYPGLGSRVARFIRMGEVRALIRGMKIEDKALETWVREGQMSMSTLEYAYKTNRVRAALGIDFDSDGLLLSHKLTKDQRRALTYLLTLFKSGELNTRSIEFKKAVSPEQDLLVGTLERIVAGKSIAAAVKGAKEHDAKADQDDQDDDQVDHDDQDDNGSDGENTDSDGHPGGGEHGGGDSGGGGTGAAGAGAGSGGDDAGQPNRGDTKVRLGRAGFTYSGDSPGMRRRYEELFRIDVKNNSNAAYDLLRTVLECAIKEYLRLKRGKLPEKMTLGWYLDQLLADFAGDTRLTGLVNRVKAAKRVGREITGTAEGLNWGNHEPDFYVDHKDVHDAWDRLLPILREVERRRATL